LTETLQSTFSAWILSVRISPQEAWAAGSEYSRQAGQGSEIFADCLPRDPDRIVQRLLRQTGTPCSGKSKPERNSCAFVEQGEKRTHKFLPQDWNLIVPKTVENGQ
jgi:hypothetical protein